MLRTSSATDRPRDTSLINDTRYILVELRKDIRTPSCTYHILTLKASFELGVEKGEAEQMATHHRRYVGYGHHSQRFCSELRRVNRHPLRPRPLRGWSTAGHRKSGSHWNESLCSKGIRFCI